MAFEMSDAQGDLALYRSTLWHIGNYVPYKKRATLHDNAITPAYRAWIDEMRTEAKERAAAGIGMENPNG